METYFNSKSKFELVESSLLKSQKNNESSSKQTCMEVRLENLRADPGLRNRILSYHPNIQDQV